MVRARTRWAAALIFFLLASAAWSQAATKQDKKSDIESRVNELLKRMTLEEKAGQLNQILFDESNVDAAIGQGSVGSVVNATGAEQVNRLQHIAVDKSRLHIPILFAYDVIHGYRTIFPVPLALAATWNPQAVERMARISAKEASAAGIRWTFSPMVDIARDPRWGRIAEGSGEDTVLDSAMAAAYVRGYQGDDLSNPASIAACVKHFAGYGAAEGGRDYNSVDMSERQLRTVYLPPFKAALDAGAVTVMSSFNTLNGIPNTANPFTLRHVLKGEWNFHGFVVSDWRSIIELISHGVASDEQQASQEAITAGVDMDMIGGVYYKYLPDLVRTGVVPESVLDDAVRRILRIKFELGLFDHPYTDPRLEQRELLAPAHVEAARQVAQESMVLLKNDGALLPLSKTTKTIALIGPLADDQADLLGNWFGKGEAKDVVSIMEGIRAKLPADARLLHSRGVDVVGTSVEGIPDAVATAKQADVVVMVLGEKGAMSGEAASRAHLGLPGKQEELLQAIVATGKPVVLVLINGRPLTIQWAADHVPAILEAWLPGIQGGNAVADLLFGDADPSGKLPVTFPRTVGQVPLYYNHLNTGRPPGPKADKKYFSGYIDETYTPLFPFGYGLSYTSFQYSGLKLSGDQMENSGKIEVSVDVKNVGTRAGTEIVQLYVHDLVAPVAQPVEELKDFQRVKLAPGAAKTVTFTLHASQLAIWDRDMKFVTEPGKYTVTIGPNSAEGDTATFSVNR